jgi:hypothetical protein
MSKPAPKSPGRPEGKKYPSVKQLRLGDEQAERLASLARAWGVSESEAMRRLIDWGWSQQGLEARVTALEARLAHPPAPGETE